MASETYRPHRSLKENTKETRLMAADLPEPLDVIAVGAHPDDVEIGIGGTLARLVQQGYRVGLVDLTDGEPTPLSPGPEVRLQEAQAAAEALGLQMRMTLPLPNRKLFDCYEHRVELAKVFRTYRPKVVIGIHDKTPMASPDHWQAMQITDAAIFYSRLTKWDDQFDHLPVHTISRQMWYSLGLRNSASCNIPNSMVVDISQTLELKLAAIREYKTQFPPEKQRVFQLVEHRDRFIGATAGFEAGEILISAAPNSTTNLMQTLFPV